MGLFTFILSVSLIININSRESFHYIILSAINEGIIPPLNFEFTVFVFVPPVYCTHNSPSFKLEGLRSFSLNEKRAPYRPGSRCNAHSNAPR
jgi:hypothetical protein